MTDNNHHSAGAAEQPSAEDIVAQTDSGARSPSGAAKTLLWSVALFWALFQLWYASPLPFVFNFGVINDTQARAIHLSFAIFLAFTAYPALSRSPKDYIPLQDWGFALLGAFSASYLVIFHAELANRAGAPITADLIFAVAGMVLLLEATRRALGPPLMVVAAVFLIYTFGGPYMPDVIAHKGASLNKTMSHQWLTTEGVLVLHWAFQPASYSCSCCSAHCWKKPGPVTISPRYPFHCWATCVAVRQKLRWYLPA